MCVKGRSLKWEELKGKGLHMVKGRSLKWEELKGKGLHMVKGRSLKWEELKGKGLHMVKGRSLKWEELKGKGLHMVKGRSLRGVSELLEELRSLQGVHLLSFPTSSCCPTIHFMASCFRLAYACPPLSVYLARPSGRWRQ